MHARARCVGRGRAAAADQSGAGGREECECYESLLISLI